LNEFKEPVVVSQSIIIAKAAPVTKEKKLKTTFFARFNESLTDE
jgi:hypothetical protein